MTITLVNIDGDPTEPVFPAQRIDSQRWNGWAKPWFDLDTVFSIVTMLTEDSPDYLIMLDGDTVVLAQDLGDGEWYVDQYEPVDGLYQFAAGTWRWFEVPVHTGHFSALGGTWWCDTCDSPLCDLA